MRDRTCRYSEAVASAKKAHRIKKEEALRRLFEYKKNNNSVQCPSSHTIVSLSYSMIGNYLEKRVCKYDYNISCRSCHREVYMCGINCKLCGSWECTQCITPYEGVNICKECKWVVSGSGIVRNAEYSMETQEQYRILKKCLKTPNNENIKQLSQILKELEVKTNEKETETRIKKNLLIRAKIALCDWYIYKAKEERYSMLFEQLEYLEVLRQTNKSYSDPIDSAIREILEEIASSDPLKGRNSKNK
ncbi:hypothetical protein NEMIN01_2008 [Nematocida minor]|uniref:uncharacterized protein n=1 Tax=Nematocida minor TaxID=1912983 RepID=UPI00221E5B71|nr:uncharacterized protein NEMIN01_2008 [Nematocida minor]KAI5192421.1 hypothetical protein NEMIN01_2008 [Nematocida minor]